MLWGIYFELCLDDGEAESVLAELAALEPVLVAKEQREMVLRWRVFALTAADKTADALQIADAIEDEGLRLRLRLHIARKLERTERGSHCAAIDALLAADSGPDVLGEACEAHARADDWAFVSEHADALLEAAPTPSSLRLLASATTRPPGIRARLLVLFHEDPARNRLDPNPVRRHPVLIRHGARPLRHLKSQADRQTRLILDLTALLTAQSLVSDQGQSLLDLIEEPADWTQALIERVAEGLEQQRLRHSTTRAGRTISRLRRIIQNPET